MRNALGGVQTVVVLGGGSDIAAATLRKMVANRTQKVVLAVRNPASVDSLADELRDAGAEVEVVAFDGADIASHEGFINGLFDRYDDIDLVFSAFGVLGNQDAFDDDPIAAADAVTVNFAGQVSVITAAVAQMKRQGHGTIAVISSVAGERVRKDNAVYGATKAGLDGYLQGLTHRLIGSGVRVMTIRPGFVHTAMTEGLDPAPFSTTADKVADDIIDGLTKGSEIVYSPGILRWVFAILRHLPTPIWRKIAEK